MHTINIHEADEFSNVGVFPKKIYNIVNDPKNQTLISWNKAGDQFIIFNPAEFSEKILATCGFSSSNYASFIRQLNLYDFHKVKSRFKEQANTFCHKYFLKDRPSMLRYIKRKSQPSGNTEPPLVENQIQLLKSSFQYQDGEKKLGSGSGVHGMGLDAWESSMTNINCPDINNISEVNSKKSKVSKHILSSLYANFLKSVSSI